MLEHRTLLSTFTVNTTNDENDANKVPGDLSLREAIIQSNATPGANTIVVPAGTYNLTIAGSGETGGQTGDLDVTNSVTIQGAGSAATIINGNSLDRVFYVYGPTSTVPTVSISGVTIENGLAPVGNSQSNAGGGISVYNASLTVDQSVIEDNQTASGSSFGGNGGGIAVVLGSLTVTNSTIANNITGGGTSLGGFGGGIAVAQGPVTLDNCVISGNVTGDGSTTPNANVTAGRGAGMYVEGNGAVVEISGSTISGNTSGDANSRGMGGGIYNESNSILSLDNSTVSGNIASLEGGGIESSSTIDHITNSTIANNVAQGDGGGFHGAGGIYNNGTITLISGTTISGNQGIGSTSTDYGGGGIYNDGHIVTIVNSTIAGNSTNNQGGGIINNRNIDTIMNVTIAGNTAAVQGGGLYHMLYSNLTPVIGALTNTIIANNVAGNAADFEELGQVNSATYDLVQSAAGNSLVNGVNGNIVGQDPQLGALADNGGPTYTMALLTGSPAIDAGTSTGAPGTDQRGLPRPSGAAVDIGAYEVQAAVNQVPVASDLNVSTNENTLLSGQVSATDADGDHLTYSVVTSTSQGSVTMHSDGSFWYTPPAFYSGTDSFTFEAYDGQAYSNVATVSITIDAVNVPQVDNIPFTTVADGTVADRNLDGVFDTVDTTSQSITDRWFTDPTIGQERGVFEFDLSRIAPGTPIQSATIALDVTSYTSTTVGGVTTYPQANFMAAVGTGTVTTADGNATATSAGTGTVSSLGDQIFTLTGTALESLEGGFAVVRIQNSALSANWFSVASLENTLGQHATLTLQIASTPTVSLSITPGTVVETAGANAATGVLTRNGDLSTPLTVNLSSNNTSQLTVPASETFAAGQSSLSFGVNAVDDGVHDNGNTVTVSAAATVVADPFGLDPSFGVDGLAPTSLTNHDWFPLSALARQPDGKILAASESSSDTWQLTRLNPDGSLDTSFGVNGVALATFAVNSSTGNYPAPAAIAVQSDGSILVGGTIVEGYGTPALCRFTASGQLDQTFGTNGFVDLSGYENQNSARVMGIALRPDGRILLAMTSGGFLQAVQLMPNGTVDSSFYTTQTVSDVTQALALLPNGQLLLAGLSKVARFNADGTLDTTFGTNGSTAVNFGSPFTFISEIAIDPADRIVVAGDAQFSNSGPDEMGVARLTATGALDTSFGSSGATLIVTGANGGSVTSLVVQPDDKIVVGGLGVTSSNRYQAALARLTNAGGLDSTFNGSGVFQQTLVHGNDNLINAIVLQPNDGRLLALTMGTGQFSVARFTMADQPAAVSASTTENVSDNDPGTPAANNDSYTTGKNTALSVAAPGVLANDTDPNNRALTAALVAGPAHGTLALHGDGSFTYTPATNFVGTDTFTYNATDGLMTSSTAAVTLTVASAAQATFVKSDSNTSGNWVGVYGAQGYDALGYTASLPSYATVTPTNNTYYVWASSTTDTRALQNPANPSGSRVAAVWYSTHNTASFTVDVNITDGQSHDLALYLLDWPNSGRSETVQLSDAATGTVLDTQTVSSFGRGVYLQWQVSGDVLITITKTAGSSAVLSGLFFDSPPAPTTTAAFLGENAPATKAGNWIGTYGAQGYDALGYTASLPSYATVTPTNNTYYVWASSTTDTRALQDPANPTGSRVAAVWYSTHNTASFTVDVNITDGQAHDLALYLLDWPNSGRAETVQLSDAATGTVLDTEAVSSFSQGVYLQWKVSGNVLITITKTAGSSAVLSGLFFDPASASTPPATASFLKQDTTTSGNWVGAYGAQGYDALGYTASVPSYATVTPTNNTYYVWASSTTDTRALQNPANPSGSRVAACWYSTHNTASFTVDVNITDGQAHDLALYLLDWTNSGRSETVQLSDAATGTVLDTESVSSFRNGVYLQWKISGNVLITITKTAGPSAVLSGLFFDSAVSGAGISGGAASIQPGVLSTPVASLADAPSALTDVLGVVGDKGPVVASGASPARAVVAVIDSTVTLAGAGAVQVTTKRPRPDGRLLQAAARRLARQSSAMVQHARTGSRGQLARPLHV